MTEKLLPTREIAYIVHVSNGVKHKWGPIIRDKELRSGGTGIEGEEKKEGLGINLQIDIRLEDGKEKWVFQQMVHVVGSPLKKERWQKVLMGTNSEVTLTVDKIE